MNVFQLMTARMHHLGGAVRIASENITHKDHPGYLARELLPFSFKDRMQAIQVSQTQGAHLQPKGLAPGALHTRVDRTNGETHSGNTVSLPKELQRANEANSKHREMVALLHSQLHMLNIVLRR